MPRKGWVRGGGAGVLAVVVLGACGSSGGGSAATTPTTASPEKTIVPDAEVTSGLAAVRAIAQGLGATLATDPTQARADLDRMYTKWFSLEGTVRKHDTDLYLAMEDGLGGMKIGVQGNKPDRVASRLADFQTAADQYLQAHP